MGCLDANKPHVGGGGEAAPCPVTARCLGIECRDTQLSDAFIICKERSRSVHVAASLCLTCPWKTISVEQGIGWDTHLLQQIGDALDMREHLREKRLSAA